jgi:hypothetical protein
MKRIFIVALTCSLTLISCNAQTKKSEKQAEGIKPQTSIKVNRQYDKNGNLIKFDSTYSSYYSNVKGDTTLKDSILNKFKKEFNQSYLFSNDPYFNNFFFQDSLLKYDFYKKDFFYNRFRDNMQQMDSLFRDMDKMKNKFFRSELNQIKKKH